MADPNAALASIGKPYRKRSGPPSTIVAIKQDLIKVNFDPYKASAELETRLKPLKPPPKLVFSPPVSTTEVKAISERQREEMLRISSPTRKLSLAGPHGSKLNFNMAGNRRSSLAIVAKRNSSLSTTGSNDGLLRKKSSSTAIEKELQCPPHGFRYHSNGDERVAMPTSASASASENSVSNTRSLADDARLSFQQLGDMRRNFLRQLSLIQSEGLMRTRSGSRMLTRKCGKVGQAYVDRSYKAPSVTSQEKASDTRIGGQGNNMFKQTMLRHVRDMAHATDNHSRHSRSLARLSSSVHLTPGGVYMAGGGASVSSRHSLTAAGSGAGLNSIPWEEDGEGKLTRPGSATKGGDVSGEAGNSSFNMRYGVPVKLMAERKHILEEQHFKEVEISQRNDAEIAEFVADLQKASAEGKRQGPRASSLPELGTISSLMGYIDAIRRVN